MPEETVQLRVYRYTRGSGAPYYDRFEVPADPRTTILTALQAARHAHDRTLALRHSCHHASCGTCGMVVNGREVLACVTNALKEAAGRTEITVEPLAGLPILTDLVVDMGPFYERFTRAGMAALRRSDHLPEAEPPSGIAAYTRYENCIECGLCVSACPISSAGSDYLGPAALAAARRVVDEPRSENPAAVLDWVDSAQGCWRCHVAYECTEACPSNVDPAGSIMALRRAVLGRRVGRLFGR